MSIQIDKGVPIAPRKAIVARLYPFADLAVGDSFLVPASGPEELRRVQLRLSAAASHRRRRGKGMFTTRQEPGGVRVWRVE